MATQHYKWFYYSAGMSRGIKVGARIMKTLNAMADQPVAARVRDLFPKDFLSGMLIGLVASYGFLLFWLAVKAVWNG